MLLWAHAAGAVQL